MKSIGDLFRRRAAGGAIQGTASTTKDSVLVRLSPGYASYDGGETWREYPPEPAEEKP